MAKLPERYIYPAVFTYEEGEEIAVVFPDLDVASQRRKTDADALTSAREPLGAVLHGMEEDGDPIPAPTPLNAVKLEENERAALVDVAYAVHPAGEGQPGC